MKPTADMLLEFRLKAGWTVRQMAEMMRTTTIGYCNMEDGTREPDATDEHQWILLNARLKALDHDYELVYEELHLAL